MRALCVGVATMDAIALVERYPHPDERVEALDLVRAGGGPAATAAVAMARLGVDVAFAGVIGDDEAGERIRAELIQEGIAVGLLQLVPGVRSGESVVIVDREGASRAIVSRPPPRPLADFDTRVARAAQEADWMHVDQWGYRVVAEARKHHPRPRISVDAGNPIPGLDCRGIDVYAPTEARLLERYGGKGLQEAMRAAREDGAGLVVVSRGERGAAGLGDGEVVMAPAMETEILSTLGAGDVFHGALVARLGASDDLRDALRWANAAAGLSCRALDGRSGIPRLGELTGVVDAVAEAGR